MNEIFNAIILATYLLAQPTEPVLECTEHSSALCETIVAMDENHEEWLHGNSDTLAYNCHLVASEAEYRGLRVEFALAMAKIESRFDPNARSDRGCIGMLQIQPRYHCPNGRERRCDTLAEGIEVALEYMKRWGPIEGISAFRSGHRNRKLTRSLHKAGERIEYSDYLISRTYGLCYNSMDICSPYIEHGQHNNYR